VSRGKDETAKMVELRNQPHDLPVFFDRVGVEVLFLEEIAEFAQRDPARYRLDVARHMICNNLFDKTIQDAILNRDSAPFNQAVSRRR
jgi:hypothetical protein